MKVLTERAKKIITNSRGKKKLSNCYLSQVELEKVIDSESTQIIENEYMVLLCDSQKDYYSIYYFLSTEYLPGLGKDLKGKIEANGLNSLNVAGRELSSEVSCLMQELDFSLYKVYVRKQYINDFTRKPIRELTDVAFAEEDDLEEVFHMLQDTFDPLTDFLPKWEELRCMLKRENVLKIVFNDEVAGVLLFENQGVKSYARALCVREKYRNNVIGYSLFSRYFNMHLSTIKLFYLWVDVENKDVLNLHNKFGYVEDGLKNYTFVK
jgi:hypothetical protein